ncbi:MAG: DUF1922 domain-containing protein [Nanoarchaeota archaeon]|nr:DUF1922 domain-containing protein [Nanoarchaeota archaeon]
MFVVFKCVCGEWQYQDDQFKTRKCSKCARTIKLVKRRVLGKARTGQEARVIMLHLKMKELGLKL